MPTRFNPLKAAVIEAQLRKEGMDEHGIRVSLKYMELPKGTYQKIVFETVLEGVRSHKGEKILKRTEMIVRVGVEYKNLTVNADKETGSLPFGEFVIYPYIIKYTNKEGVTKFYLRVTSTFNEMQKCKVKFYTEDGMEITRPEAVERCGAKAKAKTSEDNGMPIVMTIPVNSIVSL